MVFILLLTMTAVTIVSLPSTMAEAAGVGAWFVLLIASVFYAAAAHIIVSLNKMFHGEVLFDYSARLIGKGGACVLGVFYLLYFTLISSYLCAGMANILVTNFFVKTPAWATILIGIPFYAYTAYKGITNIGRMFEIIGFFFIVAAVSVHIVMMFQGKVENILPLFIPEDTALYLKALPSTIISFLGIEVLTLTPIASGCRNKAPRTAFFAVLGIGLFYVLNVETSVMMIGINEVQNENNALISAIRQLQIPPLDFLERLDILYLTMGFMGLFAAKTIIVAAIVEYACKLFRRAGRVWVVIAACAAVFLIDLFLLKVNRLGKLFELFGTYAGNLAAVVIPAALFVLAKVKKHACKAG